MILKVFALVIRNVNGDPRELHRLFAQGVNPLLAILGAFASGQAFKVNLLGDFLKRWDFLSGSCNTSSSHALPSTGLKTPEGKARIAQVQKKRWAMYRELNQKI